MHRALIATLLLCLVSFARAQNVPVVPLWPNGAPGSEAKKDVPEVVSANGATITNVHNPSILLYLPSKETATGTAIVVAPGGGHRNLAIGHEGYNVGKWLAEHGIAAFVLKYRLAREPESTYTIEGNALEDMKRAIRTVRSRAAEWNVKVDRVGAMGFSAGGELAEVVAIKNDKGNADATDPIEKQSCRPDFQVLIYPGTSNLIEPTADSPPAFLAAGNNDRPDISVGLAEAYLRFKKVNIPVELHIYAATGHGFGIRDTQPAPSHQAWPVSMVAWLKQMKLMDVK